MIYFKFLQPSNPDFIRKKTRWAFERMFIPLPGDPVEKYCYVKYPVSLRNVFWDVLKNMDEFPTGIEHVKSGRALKFEIITPPKKII